MAELSELLVEAKIAGYKTNGGYFFRSNEGAAERVLKVLGGCVPELLDFLVEAGKLEQTGGRCSICGFHPHSTPTWCEVGCGRDYQRMSPVYVATREDSEN